MTIECQTLDVKIKANITATNMLSSLTECVEPCDANVTITWTNTGGIPGTFEPAIIINGVRTWAGYNQNVSAGATFSETFNLTALENGTYTYCPDPN